MLRVEDVSVRFGETSALDEASLEVQEGEVVAVLGPSGSGKSTLLRVIAGLQRPDAGRVLLNGVDLAGTPPHRRGIGLVFQDHALFHHRDVSGNVAFGLRMRGDSPGRQRARVRELLELVGLAGFEERRVSTLSGGEQQRVALVRALAPEPRILLLDEPLGSLDRRLRDRLLADLERTFETLSVTALHVTHDQAEAFALGDRVAVMRAGRVVQEGTPDELWARPVDEDTARFLGLVNVRQGTVIRPEAVRVTRADDGDGVVTAVARHGPLVRLTIERDGGETLVAAVVALDHPRAGERVRVDVDPAGVVQLEQPVSDTGFPPGTGSTSKGHVPAGNSLDAGQSPVDDL
jgi:thiamine transport system ATP-binding protein